MYISNTRTRVWIALLLCSTVLHGLVSWRVGQKIELQPVPVTEEEVQIVIEHDAEVLVEKIHPPEEQLEFQDDIELDPPEVLITPKAVTPPPLDVSVALRAQGAGFQGLDIPEGLGFVSLANGTGVGGFNVGIGNGLGDGSARFAPYIAGLREAGLDVVFRIDATGSMGWVINEVKDRIEDITQIVRSLVPISRFGFVAYRDRDDPEFLTQIQPLTYSTTKLYRFLSRLRADGGGDWFEAIDAGLEVAINQSSWRSGARKLIILIGDAPLKDEQLYKVVAMVRQFQRTEGTVSTLDVSEQANPHLLEAKLGREVPRHLYRDAPMPAFLDIGEAGRGDAATLDGEIKLTKRLITLIMGDQFAAEMQALLDVL